MDAIDKTRTPRSARDLLMDIQWNCEHCRLLKYGYGGQV